MLTRRYRAVLAIVLLLASAGGAVWYVLTHPGVFRRLADLPPLTLLVLIVLYIGFIGCIALILLGTVLMCRVRLSMREGALVTAYSSIINFFGPLQSGPAFRAIYLKKVHAIKLKDYGMATMLYYGIYGGVSVVLLFAVPLGAWMWALAAAGAVLLLIMAVSKHPLALRTRKAGRAGAGLLILATLLQISLQSTIYYVELKATGSPAGILQVLSYTGAANLALFVAITPGAIGIRESFLYLSQRLHGISTDTIVASNLVDRSAYITVLGALALIIASTHANRELRKYRADAKA